MECIYAVRRGCVVSDCANERVPAVLVAAKMLCFLSLSSTGLWTRLQLTRRVDSPLYVGSYLEGKVHRQHHVQVAESVSAAQPLT
jgi:hypothetical protein